MVIKSTFIDISVKSLKLVGMFLSLLLKYIIKMKLKRIDVFNKINKMLGT